MELKDKKILLLGVFNATAVPIIQYLHKAKVSRIIAQGKITALEAQNIQKALAGISFDLITEDIAPQDLKAYDLVLLTPVAERHYPLHLKFAQDVGIQVISDLDLALQRYRAPVIAVTGTNGKSTLVHLISRIFENSKKSLLIAGGEHQTFLGSLLEDKSYDFVLIELSSTRLKYTQNLKPFIAVLLNIYPHHLERHKSFEEYAATKGRVYEKQDEKDFFVYQNSSDAIRLLMEKKPCRAQAYPFSFEPLGNDVKQGACLDKAGKKNLFMSPLRGKAMFSYSHIGETGTHNLENALAAVIVAKLCEIPDIVIQSGLDGFKPLAGRMELLGKIGGVQYYNDGRALNAYSTLSGMHHLKDRSVILIMGGEPNPMIKSKFFTEMIQAKVKTLIFYGGHRKRYYEILGHLSESYTAIHLKEAVDLAARLSLKGDNVVYSPASFPESALDGTTKMRMDAFQAAFESLKMGQRKTMSPPQRM